MKKWGLRILLAHLTFALGLGATNIMRVRRPAEAVKPPPALESTNNQVQPPPPQIEEDTKPVDEVDKGMEPHLVSISPYEIKRLIDENNKAALLGEPYDLDLEPIWKQLSIKESAFDLNQCKYSCHADIAALEVDSRPGVETLLRLSAEESDRYLLFKRIGARRTAGETWELIGYIDAFTRWCACKYRIATVGAERWLVIEKIAGHGSGFGSYADAWYEVSEKGVVPVLSYQTSLFEMAWEARPSVERETKVRAIDFNAGITSVVLESSTSHKSSDGDFLLWTSYRKTAFIKGPGMQQFVFDPLHSEMTADELDPQFGDDVNITAEEFLKYNYRELARLAISGSAKQKEWLRNYLSTCDDSVEKKSLESALKGSRP